MRELEDAVYAAARAVVGDAPLGEAALARAVVDRSKRYTSERDKLSTPPDRIADLAARACFFTIADAMKIATPLRELGALVKPSIRVVDLGAGCGAMSLGIATTLPDRALEILAIDRDADALRIARGALETLAPKARVTTKTDDVASAAIPSGVDLVVMGTVLNELPEPARLALVRRALAAIAPDGAVIIVEPALRETSRALHALRDAILAANEAHVFAPCTRQGACPALLDPDDWCHEDRPLDLPPRTRTIAARTHLRDGGMRFAYLVLRREPTPLVPEAGAAWRVVSAPHVEKGKREVFACSDRGRVKLRLLKRHRGPENRAFEHAERGDVLVIDLALPDETPGKTDIPSSIDIGERRVTKR